MAQLELLISCFSALSTGKEMISNIEAINVFKSVRPDVDRAIADIVEIVGILGVGNGL